MVCNCSLPLSLALSHTTHTQYTRVHMQCVRCEMCVCVCCGLLFPHACRQGRISRVVVWWLVALQARRWQLQDLRFGCFCCRGVSDQSVTKLGKHSRHDTRTISPSGGGGWGGGRGGGKEGSLFVSLMSGNMQAHRRIMGWVSVCVCAYLTTSK